jgi:hypothetical protein
MRSTLAALALSCIALGTAAVAQPPHCPPGHAKKGWCTPGGYYRLQPGAELRTWGDWRERGFPAPGPGRRYVVVDREAFLIVDATREVVEALGAVDRLMRN